MGPLIPYIFSNEFGLFIAILLGVAFGFTLEQAGFSSTKKLVGLFYGYDFTVLRVFFTAGITAMIGVLFLGHYGLLDLSVIYVNPTFLRSAIVGGLIMGGGFIIGGFCPGTSVCAASTGKIDAMFFIIGSIIGIFAFTESYPLIADFYVADNMGALTMFDMFGMSKEWFGVIMCIIAVGAFYGTWLIENKVNKRKGEMTIPSKRKYVIGTLIPLLFLLVVLLFPSKKEIIAQNIVSDKEQQRCVFNEISADKLAYEITTNYYLLNVIDVRPKENYEKYHLPLAINIPFDQIQNREWESIFRQEIKTNVFYADSITLVKMSCLRAKYIGPSKNLILSSTVDEFKKMFFNLAPPPADASKHEMEVYHFRLIASKKMNDLVKSLQNIGKPVKKEMKTVKGGCS